MESTGYAVIRLLLKHGKTEEILKILNDPVCETRNSNCFVLDKLWSISESPSWLFANGFLSERRQHSRYVGNSIICKFSCGKNSIALHAAREIRLSIVELFGRL